MSGEIKTFVVDTNVFIHRPDAILSFRDNEIVVPLWVLEELDKLKSYSDEKGRNARQAIRMLDELGKHGSLSEGVKMPNGSVLRVVLNYATGIGLDLDESKNDNRILLAAYGLQKQGKRVFFVSKDINARVKATAIGIKAVDYEKQKVNFDELYSGVADAQASPQTLRALADQGSIPWDNALQPNQFVVLTSEKDGLVELARFRKETQTLDHVFPEMNAVCGVRPLNRRQRIAFELLLDDSISLVTLVGKAGTGKTLLAIAAGLKKTIELKKYKRVLVTRPIIPMGKDIGYLPGAKEEKLSHWMQPLFDNLEYILGVYNKPKLGTVDQLLDTKVIEVEALTYIRGRSLPEQYIIIDEAQNLSPHEVKTIVSRAGAGSKVIITGDPYQIDNPYLDANSNGLSYLVEAFKGQKMYGQIILDKSERSELAELAAELL